MEHKADIIDLAAYRNQLRKPDNNAASPWAQLLHNLPPGSKEIDLLGLRPRTRNLLCRSGLMNIDQLLAAPDEQLLGLQGGIKRFGKTSLLELKQKLTHFVLNYP